MSLDMFDFPPSGGSQETGYLGAKGFRTGISPWTERLAEA